MVTKIDFLLRVHCATYNHVAFITNALDGFAMQKTLFPFVCTIVDDASTDGEQEIIKNYLQGHFDLQDDSVAYDMDMDYGHVTFAKHKTNENCFFAVLYLKENHYCQKKSKAPYLQEWMDSKYIAICEGDDYWTDPYKLQKQVGFLEQHPGYVACFHNARVQFEDHVSLFNDLEENHHFTAEDIIKRNWFISTQTLLYRNVIHSWPEWSKGVVNGDYLTELLLAKEGDFYYMDDVMAVYRQHGNGVSVTLDKNKVDLADKLISLLTNMKLYYNGEYASAFDESIRKYQTMREEYVKEGFYASHPVARLFRLKTYKRFIKKQLRRVL